MLLKRFRSFARSWYTPAPADGIDGPRITYTLQPVVQLSDLRYAEVPVQLERIVLQSTLVTPNNQQEVLLVGSSHPFRLLFAQALDQLEEPLEIVEWFATTTVMGGTRLEIPETSYERFGPQSNAEVYIFTIPNAFEVPGFLPGLPTEKDVFGLPGQEQLMLKVETAEAGQIFLRLGLEPLRIDTRNDYAFTGHRIYEG